MFRRVLPRLCYNRGLISLLRSSIAVSGSSQKVSYNPLSPLKVPLRRQSNEANPQQNPKTVNITFVDRDGEEHTVLGRVGDTLLEVAKKYDIDLEGACEGTLACSTCHLIVNQEWFDKIPDPITDEEQDMLDLAYGLTDTSRLGCQILVSPEINNIKLKVPEGTSDARNL